MKEKILKIKVGEAYINGKNVSVFNTAFQRISKDGKRKYYQISNPVFVQEIEKKSKEEAIEDI